MVTLSMALSLASITSRHYQHSHQSFTPLHTPPCLTTETACRFHRPAVSHQRGKHEGSVTGKRDPGPQNVPQPSVRTRTAFTEQEQALQSVEIKGRLGLEKNRSDSPRTCKWRTSPCKSKMEAGYKSGNNADKLKTHGDPPALLGLSSLLFSQILSRNLVFQPPCPSRSLLNSFTTGYIQNDFVLSNLSHGTRDSNWYRGHTNSSYICVA